MSKELDDYLKSQRNLTKEILFCQDTKVLRATAMSLLKDNGKVAQQYLEMHQAYEKVLNLATLQAVRIKELEGS